MKNLIEEKLHRLIERQLKRLNLTQSELPKTLEIWQEFILHMNKIFYEADKERELLERSMSLSSSEFVGLNEKLREAQKIAQMGYWIFDKKTNLITLSPLLTFFLNLGTKQLKLPFQDFVSQIHEEDIKKFLLLLDACLLEKIDMRMELRFNQGSGSEYNWYSLAMRPFTEDGARQVTGTMININTAKETQIKLEKLHSEMLDMAHQAGMAEVATSILHNVGNTLNSVNVSFKMVSDFFNSEKLKKLKKTIDMIEDNMSDLANYFASDPKGVLIPKYIVTLGKSIDEDRMSAEKELNFLNDNIVHINTIVAAESDLSNMKGFSEKLYLPEIIDNALHMTGLIESTLSKNKITVVKQYEEKPFIHIDKAKLLQILVNLLKNARESLEESESKNKQIIVVVRTNSESNQLEIQVQDTGLGILEENLIKIFSHGFTTKKKGHGFGLHNSALAAKSILGDLRVESLGLKQGATFVLTLPQNTLIKEEVLDVGTR